MCDNFRCMHGIVVEHISIEKVDSFVHTMYTMQGILRKENEIYLYQVHLGI
jgi:hypothetical protein